MAEYIAVGGPQVASVLHTFVPTEALPGSGVAEAEFWAGKDETLANFTPRKRDFLARLDELQGQLDEWHTAYPRPEGDQAEYLRLYATSDTRSTSQQTS